MLASWRSFGLGAELRTHEVCLNSVVVLHGWGGARIMHGRSRMNIGRVFGEGLGGNGRITIPSAHLGHVIRRFLWLVFVFEEKRTEIVRTHAARSSLLCVFRRFVYFRERCVAQTKINPLCVLSTSFFSFLVNLLRICRDFSCV